MCMPTRGSLVPRLKATITPSILRNLISAHTPNYIISFYHLLLINIKKISMHTQQLTTTILNHQREPDHRSFTSTDHNLPSPPYHKAHSTTQQSVHTCNQHPTRANWAVDFKFVSLMALSAGIIIQLLGLVGGTITKRSKKTYLKGVAV